MKRNITLDQMFKICSKPKSRKEPHVGYCHILEKSVHVIDYVLKKNSKVVLNRFDLSFPQNGFFTNDNTLFVKYIETLTKYYDRHNLEQKYFWIKSTSQSDRRQIYHLFLLCKDHNTTISNNIFEMASKLWMKLLNTEITGLVNYSLSDNGIMIDRNSSDYMDAIEKCIFIVSYFAKIRCKGFCQSGIRDFGSSRV